MARSIDYRSTLAFPAEKVFATMTDEEYLRARLRELGGPGSDLLDYEASPENARYRLRQGLSERDLPPIVGKVVGGDLHIERTETLRRSGPGSYDGDVDGKIPEVHADVAVNVPLFGGKIEEIVAEQVRRLLEVETAFTVRWLGSH